MLPEIIWLGVTGFAAGFGYLKTRHFFRGRLRFVDAAHSNTAPLVSGVVAGLIAAPVVWLLPVVGTLSAITFGVGVGLGAAHGSRDVKRLSSGI